MQRTVITGLGIASCLGNTRQDVLAALRAGQSGIQHNPSYAEHGFKSQVSGNANIDTTAIDRKLKRFMGDAAAFAYLAAVAAVKDAGLTLDAIANNPDYGVIAGSGTASPASVLEGVDALRSGGMRRVPATLVPRVMSSTVSASVATALRLHGVNYAISSACATSAHCIGNASELIGLGKQTIILAGGGEEEHWSQTALFDAMGAISSKYNAQPHSASRPYCASRDGFVIAGGGGMLVLESLEHAEARGANILAEVVGYGATSDGADMVAPSGEGAVRCMQMALKQAAALGVEHIDYINTHGTSTPIGDVAELHAIASVFKARGQSVPPISSTKSMTGHSLGAAGVHEAIYCLLMMEHGFIAPSINIETLDDVAKDFDIVQQTREVPLNTVMSNSFGFGGTNATLILRKFVG